MALINPNVGQVVGAPESASDKKAKKAEAAKRHAEKVAKQKKEYYELSLQLRDVLLKQAVLDKLPQNLKDFIATSCRDPAESAQPTSGTQFFVTLFGAAAKVGDQITLLDAFKKVQMAKGGFEKKFREWESKGNRPAKIDVIPNADVMATVYKVAKINL